MHTMRKYLDIITETSKSEPRQAHATRAAQGGGYKLQGPADAYDGDTKRHFASYDEAVIWIEKRLAKAKANSEGTMDRFYVRHWGIVYGPWN